MSAGEDEVVKGGQYTSGKAPGSPLTGPEVLFQAGC